MTEQQSVKPKEKGQLSPKTYRITFLPEGKTIEAGPPDPDAHHEGEPGSILDWADRSGINIDHACGGFAACSTCHVIVRKGLDSCNEMEEDEEDMLDLAFGLTPTSRLGCQIIITEDLDGLTVTVPAETFNQLLG